MAASSDRVGAGENCIIHQLVVEYLLRAHIGLSNAGEYIAPGGTSQQQKEDVNGDDRIEYRLNPSHLGIATSLLDGGSFEFLRPPQLEISHNLRDAWHDAPPFWLKK